MSNCFSQSDINEYLNDVKIDFNKSSILPESIISENDIILIGETHGFRDNYTIAYQFISEYKMKTNFEYVLAEIDWASAQELNSILINSDTLKLKAYIDDSKGSPAWCKERYDFYLKLMHLNQSTEKKIKYVGVDIPSGGIKLALLQIKNIQSEYNIDTQFLDSLIERPRLNDSVINHLKHLLTTSSNSKFDTKDLFEYKYQINNIIQYSIASKTTTMKRWDQVRDSCMFENYKLLEKHLNLYNQKMIGIWGSSHVYQKQSEGISWFASKLKKDLNKKIYSYRIFYFDSKCMLHSNWLPGILKVFKSKKKMYLETKLQNDDSFATGKKKGIKDLLKSTSKKSITFFDLTKSNSPYKINPLLVINGNVNWTTTDYFQTAIVVRNSSATEPLGENKK